MEAPTPLPFPVEEERYTYPSPLSSYRNLEKARPNVVQEIVQCKGYLVTAKKFCPIFWIGRTNFLQGLEKLRLVMPVMPNREADSLYSCLISVAFVCIMF